MKIRGNSLLKKIDRYTGIPLVFAASLFHRKRKLPEDIKSIGILLTPAIGDAIVLQAVLRDIKQTAPKTRITLFGPHAVIETVRLLNYSDEIVEINVTNILGTIKCLRGYKMELLVDVGQWTRLSALISGCSGAKHSRGFKTAGQYRHYLFDSVVEHSSRVHEVENFRTLFGIVKSNMSLLPSISLPKNIEIIERRIVIHLKPGGANPHLKEWPVEYWTELVLLLQKNGYEIYFTGAPADRISVEELVQRLPSDNIHNMAGKLTMAETAELLKSAQLVFSVNTGIMHLASALGCNLVALNGPTNNKRWGPLNTNSVSIQSSYHQAPCLNLGFEYSCSDKTGECMKAISLKQVIEAAGKFIEIKK